MIVLEGLMYAIGYYLFWMLGIYLYCVASTWNLTKIISFKIENGYIGIYEAPKFFFFWTKYFERKGRA